MENQENNVELLGEYLKQKRIDKNFTIEKLSQKTKISINILKNLEANDYQNLPNPAYLKGFVRSYVKTLGISEEEALEKMDYTYAKVTGKPLPGMKGKFPQPSSEKPVERALDQASSKPRQSPHEVIQNGENLIESTKSIFPVLILGVILLVCFGAYKLISTIVTDEVSKNKAKNLGPRIETSAALVTNTPPPEVPQATTEPTENKDEKAAGEKEPAPVVEETPVVKPKPEIVRNFPTISFYKVRSTLFQVNEAKTEEFSSLLPREVKEAMNPAAQNVYIKALDGNTWLSYKIDSNPIMSVIINQGKDLFLQGNEIRIFLGNVNVTRIFYNNKLIDTPSKTGVKSLIFPIESTSKFMFPLFPKAKDDVLYTSEDYMKRMKIEEDEIKLREQQ